MDRAKQAEELTVEGILVASEAGRVRILLDQIAIDLEEDDVLDVTPLPPPPLLIERVAQAVRLELRRPTRLLHIGNASVYESVIWKRGQLFSLRTRRRDLEDAGMSPSYLELERAFFQRYGLAPPVLKEVP